MNVLIYMYTKLWQACSYYLFALLLLCFGDCGCLMVVSGRGVRDEGFCCIIDCKHTHTSLVLLWRSINCQPLLTCDSTL